MNYPLNPTLNQLLNICRLNRTWVRAEGAWLSDSDGRKFLDCYSQYGVMALGHNAPCIVNALHKALQEYVPAMVQPYRAPYAEKLATELVRLAPGNLSYCTFTTSGAEAVEAAIKLVRSRTGRPIILSTNGSFHGKTLGALAATDQPQYKEGFGPFPSHFEYVPFGNTSALSDYLSQNANQVAGFLLEPIQGERGVYLPPPNYLQQVRELCTKYDIALILDEIQTGLGRTGKLFACEYEKISPDILLIAKAIGGGIFPLGACLSSHNFWDEQFALKHSSTFANNNLACCVGLAVLEKLTQEGFCEEVAIKGKYFLNQLETLRKKYPRIIADVRGRGLLCALELKSIGEQEGGFISFLEHQGLYAYAIASTIAEKANILVLPKLGNTNVLRLAPPLIITKTELDFVLEGIESTCESLNQSATRTIVEAIGILDGYNPIISTQKQASKTNPAITLPSPKLKSSKNINYAFLLHYTCLNDIALTDPAIGQLGKDNVYKFYEFVSHIPSGLALESPTITSLTGAIANGVLILLPLLPEDMLKLGYKHVSKSIRHGVDVAAYLGAKIVGLGGFTTPYSRRGLDIIGRGPAITTGNVLTAGMAFEATCWLAKQQGLNISESNVSIVGARGSVGKLCAKLFARARPRKLTLVGNPATKIIHLEQLKIELNSIARELSIDIRDNLNSLDESNIVLTATGAGYPVLDNAPLSAGTIVCDIARPSDTSKLRERKDLTIIEGGLVSLPTPSARFGIGNIQGFPDGIQLACLSETILLALEGTTQNWGIGSDVQLSEVDYMMNLAKKHGFDLAPPIHQQSIQSSTELALGIGN